MDHARRARGLLPAEPEYRGASAERVAIRACERQLRQLALAWGLEEGAWEEQATHSQTERTAWEGDALDEGNEGDERGVRGEGARDESAAARAMAQEEAREEESDEEESDEEEASREAALDAALAAELDPSRGR